MLMLMAHGANEVSMPCRFFRDQAEADAFVQEWMIPKYVKDISYDDRRVWECKDWSNPDPKLMATLFTHYYGGCGEVDHFELMEIPFNRAFLVWDLD